MKNLTLILGMAITVATGVTHAATYAPGGDTMQRQMTRQPAEQTQHEGYGVLKAVNTESGKVQLAHEAIPSLHWSAMTMWFALRDPLPREVKVGDSVRFELEQTESKQWVITRIERKR